MTEIPLRIIGLTGGIACGKSTVADYLERQYGCLILDADIYARQAVDPTSPLLQRIQDRYGSNILTSAGQLDRQKLGQIVFQDNCERRWLEDVIHPYVREQLIAGCDRHRKISCSEPNDRSPLVMVIPLLFESQMEDLVTDIWVVSCPPAIQQQRLMSRNHLSTAQAKARIESQWPLAEKIKRASVVLDNSGDRNQIYPQIDAAFSALDLEFGA